MSLLNSDSENVQSTTESFSLEHEEYNSDTNALAILQYLTCPSCQEVLAEPVTFQCGNSLCRDCIPNSSQYANQCKCPIYGCGKYHSLDCKTDVSLQKLTDICRKELTIFLPLRQSRHTIRQMDNTNESFQLLDEFQTSLEENSTIKSTSKSRISNLLNSNDFGGGAVTELRSGRMNHHHRRSMTTTHFDLRHIKNLIMTELDCQICCSLFIDPITTPCGHSFCKSCLTRSLDHNSACPLCRHQLHNYNAYLHHPINKTIYTFIRALYPSLYAERKFALESEFFNTTQDTPIFVTALVFPKMPYFLHVFEPKYRLMIRRCMQSRQRQFGMVLTNGTSYHDYGTMLEIRSAEFLTDGRSLVETIGTYRFKVAERGIKDGYDVGRIERIDDISPEDEERIEKEELMRAQIHNNNPINVPIREYTTSELIGISRDFIETLRNGNTPWLLQRLNSVYGDMPDDPSDFSYWVASVIPIDEVEKYKLLQTKSVRERLKLIVEWITSLRDQWWFARGCSIS
ncbi:8695_t:CDS:1 [Funneliformis geosporum]|uniref:12470_t:CDS:1 n=1 Tax=Funneliformis geosporum TaxID=1117311 RepID=A0A9W4WPR2_9GLOM|nr:8695_t:CDS:1 [Funneliformis geosporum]CAI2162763.1 12470_t:CDS:1 [Funneliformis geosporum]